MHLSFSINKIKQIYCETIYTEVCKMGGWKGRTIQDSLVVKYRSVKKKISIFIVSHILTDVYFNGKCINKLINNAKLSSLLYSLGTCLMLKMK